MRGRALPITIIAKHAAGLLRLDSPAAAVALVECLALVKGYGHWLFMAAHGAGDVADDAPLWCFGLLRHDLPLFSFDGASIAGDVFRCHINRKEEHEHASSNEGIAVFDEEEERSRPQKPKKGGKAGEAACAAKDAPHHACK